MVVALKLSAAAAMFAWLISKGHLDSRALGDMSAISLLIGFGLLNLQGAGNAIRLYWLFKLHGLPVSVSRSTSITWVALAFNQLLPGGAGGDAARVYYAAQDHPHAKGDAFAVVLFDKVIGLAGLLLLGAVPWAVAASFSEGMPREAVQAIRVVGATMAVSFALIASFAFIALSPRRNAAELLARLRARLGGRFGRLIDPLTSLLAVHRGRRSRLLGLTAFSSLLHMISCVALYLLARAAGDGQSLILHLSLWSVVFLTTAIPLSPGGIGVAEAAAAKLWLLCGVTTGAATYLAFRILCLAQAAVGLAVYVAIRRQSTAGGRYAAQKAPSGPNGDECARS
jgi:glycosyltransferase 2 family protein